MDRGHSVGLDLNALELVAMNLPLFGTLELWPALWVEFLECVRFGC